MATGVHFDVTQWAPVVPSRGMVAHAPVTESDRVALQVDRGTRFYGNTRSWPRYGYPEGIPAHDDDMRKPGRHGLTHKPMNVAGSPRWRPVRRWDSQAQP